MLTPEFDKTLNMARGANPRAFSTRIKTKNIIFTDSAVPYCRYSKTMLFRKSSTWILLKHFVYAEDEPVQSSQCYGYSSCCGEMKARSESENKIIQIWLAINSKAQGTCINYTFSL